MIIDDVNRGIKKHKARKRIGRGPGSGHGKTSTRGHKGAGSRSGNKRRQGFEGGQTPLFMRVAKRGFNNNAFAPKTVIFNLSQLDAAFEDGAEITLETLVTRGLLKGKFDRVKILGDGDTKKKFTVSAHRFSKSAEEKIVAAGGSVSRVA
ncbi:MAG: 50S ribosomal protein L15 [Planctomycetaceae bacterium]|nr:50S ribosomal protein L15 [Planctomycetaceae bacterium]